jgi:hypothetical protein
LLVVFVTASSFRAPACFDVLVKNHHQYPWIFLSLSY